MRKSIKLLIGCVLFVISAYVGIEVFKGNPQAAWVIGSTSAILICSWSWS